MQAFAELFIDAPEVRRGIAGQADAVQEPSEPSLSSPELSGKGLVRVLLVGCGQELQEQLQHRLLSPHWELHLASSGAAALTHLREHSCDLVLVAPALADLDATELRQLLQSRFPAVQVFDLNGFVASAKSLVSAPRDPYGAHRPSSLILSSEKRPAPPVNLVTSSAWEGMVGASAGMQSVFRVAALVARKDTTVLIGGESGTGKDLLARGIHNSGRRARQPSW